MIIALTDPGREPSAYERYASWMSTWIPGVTLRKIGYRDNGPGLDGCSGLVLTGGGDVHPRLYGKVDALELTSGVDERRDTFELGVIDRALGEKMPVLGICRGTQIFNISQGGTLIPDIEHEGFPSHRKTATGDRVHSATLQNGTLLAAVTGTETGEINSSHHQAVSDPGRNLKISVRSVDGIPEGLEWESPAGRSFLLLVQWHPERMTHSESPFAKNIALRFAEEARRFSGQA